MTRPEEHVCEVGYINADRQHVLISIKNPTLSSCHCLNQRDLAQVSITIENAIALRAELNRFLERHGIKAH